MGDRASASSHVALACLTIFALTFGYFALFVHYGWNESDEGVLLAQYYRTYTGEVPVRDFHIGYTPGGYYFNAALFHWFGPVVTSLRWALVMCHALVAAWLFAIGRRVMPAAFACLAPLTYCASMPFFPGEFASFNVPYPAWYCVLFVVAGVWTLLRFIEGGRIGWLAAAGLLVGVCFSFKPNIGLFQLAMSGLILLVVLEPPTGNGRSRDVAAWWTLLIGIFVGLVLVFASQASLRDMAIFLLPIVVVLVTLGVRRAVVGVAGAPPQRLSVCALVFGVAMLVPVVPWATYFLYMLGPAWFARALLFIGTGFEHFYYVSFHQAGPWDIGLVLGALGMVGTGLALRAGRLPPRTVVVAGGVVALGCLVALTQARMPEGLRAALMMRIEDLSYTATLIVHWVALAALVPVIWTADRSRRALIDVAILCGALAMYLTLYPRSHFFHLVVAVPMTLVLCTFLAARFVVWLPEVMGLRRMVRVGLVGGVVCIAVVRVWPGLASALTWDGGPGWRQHAHLDLARAPLTLEAGRAPRLRALHDTVEFLRANSRPDDRVFTFPAIEVLCFLADRRNATRHGYFFPGWPGHQVEAEVVSALGADPPRLVVVLQAHQIFFLHSPAYYYALREFIEAHYREVARFGSFAVLAHRTVPDSELVTARSSVEQGPAALLARYHDALTDSQTRLSAARALAAERLVFSWQPVTGMLIDSDPAIREAALTALAGVTGSDVAAPLIDALHARRVPKRQRLVVLRRLLAVGDARIVGDLVDLLDSTSDAREREVLLLALDIVGRKITLREYWLGDTHALEIVPGDLRDIERWQRRLVDPDEEDVVRLFLARLLPRLDARALGPALCGLLSERESPELRSAAADGLLRLAPTERPCDPLEALLAIVEAEPIFAPSLILQRYREDVPAQGRRLVAALGPDASGALAWVVSVTGDGRFSDAFVAMLGHPDPKLRLAALAGLERIGDPSAARVVGRVAAGDPDYEVRASAERALVTLDRKASVVR